jgi:hypothetical protein
MGEIKITPEQPQESAEHIAAMVAKAEGNTQEAKPTEPAPAGDQAQTERPAWLPEKFNSPEDLAKAYAALEGKLGGGAKDGDEKPTEQAEVEAAANKAVDAAGLDMDSLGSKIMKNGDLDASDYEALEKQGISKEMVKSFVAGQQALASQMVSRMHETVGGEENFNELLGWAADNLSKDEIKAFNDTIDNGSEAAVKLALQGLNARYKAEAEPKLIGGNRAGAASGDVFRSTAELTNAMSDPRYTRDPAYRADVMAKLARSDIM